MATAVLLPVAPVVPGAAGARPSAPPHSCVVIDADFDIYIDLMMAIPIVIGSRHVAAVDDQLPGLNYTYVDVPRSACDKTPNEPGCPGAVYGLTLAMDTWE